MEKQFSDSGFVATIDARRCSGFARIVIAASPIAVSPAARRRGASNAVSPTPATSGVRRAGWIIATGNERTADATRRSA
jgi:hypothetical protein